MKFARSMKVERLLRDSMKNNSVSEGEGDDSLDDDSEVESKSPEIFNLPLKKMPSAVIEVIDNMENDDKEKLREEFGVSDREEGASDYNPDWMKVISVKKPAVINVLLEREPNAMRREDVSYDITEEEEISRISHPSQANNLLTIGDFDRKNEQKMLISEPSKDSGDEPLIMVDKLYNDQTNPNSQNGSKNGSQNGQKNGSKQGSQNGSRSSIGQKLVQRQPLLRKNTLLRQNNLSFPTQRKLSSASSVFTRGSQRSLVSLNIDQVADILQKPHKERTSREKEELSQYMQSNVAFFQTVKEKDYVQKVSKGSTPHLTKQDKQRMYEVIVYKVYPKGEVLCEYNTYGDRFFIILQGIIGIRVPSQIEKQMNCTWDIFKYVLKEFEFIRMYKDAVSKECSQIIKIIGAKMLREELKFTRVHKFVEFLKGLENLNPDILELYPKLNEETLLNEKRKISVFRKRLIGELRDRIEDKSTGSISKIMPAKEQITMTLQVMEHVNQLVQGQSFGQDALISENPRNATCYVMSDKCITAVLTKIDFRRVLFEREKQHIDLKIGQIMMFDIFKKITKRKLKNTYRFFYNSKTQEPYEAFRHQYLYRQGDPVNGIFCILQGQVKRIKETHNQDFVPYDKRKKQRPIVLTLLDKGETIGIEEIVMRQPKRAYSIQVASENCFYLQLSVTQFRDKFWNQSHALKHAICEKLEMQEKFIEDLEAKKSAFQQINSQLSLPVEEIQSRQKQQNESGMASNKNQSNGDAKQLSALKDISVRYEHQSQHNNHNNYATTTSTSKKASHPTKIKEMAQYTDMRTNQTNLSSARVAKKKNPSHPQILRKRMIQDSTDALFAPDEIQRDTTLERIEQEIKEELEKRDTDVEKVRQSMKMRSREIAQDLQDGIRQKAINQQKHLSSVSKSGKVIEQKLCQQFTALHAAQEQRKKMGPHHKPNIQQLTGQLASHAHGISQGWKQERQFETLVDKILDSLTKDKRIIKSMKVFRDKVPKFLDFIQSQDIKFIRSLDVPVFKGSLLLEVDLPALGEDNTIQLQSSPTINMRDKDKSAALISKRRSSLVMLGNHRNSKQQLFENRRNHKSMMNLAGDPNLMMSYSTKNVRKNSINASQNSVARRRKSVASQDSRKTNQPQQDTKKRELIKVFFDWLGFQYTEEKIQQINRRDSILSVQSMQDRIKETAMKALQNIQSRSQIGSVDNTTSRVSSTAARKRSIKRAASYDIPSLTSTIKEKLQTNKKPFRSRYLFRSESMPISPQNGMNPSFR